MPEASVAIPTRDAGPLFAGVLRALSKQTVTHELLVCDSGSRDGTVELAREHGARVLEIAPESFTHGGVRNRLMQEAEGSHVALLTQDAEPADERWLERLLGAFSLAQDVGLAYGPYRPRPAAPEPVRLELRAWFSSLAPADSPPRIDRLADGERERAAHELLGRLGFFTDANACISRAAWLRVPFREVPYAEDRVLAMDMLRAGYAKAYVPQAAVIHSHSYTAGQQVRRCFDEWRGLLEVYGWREPLSPRRLLGALRGELASARAALTAEGVTGARRRATLVAVTRHHLLCRTGALLGSRADRLAPGVTRLLSLERRAGFSPLEDHDIRNPTEQDTPPR